MRDYVGGGGGEGSGDMTLSHNYASYVLHAVQLPGVLPRCSTVTAACKEPASHSRVFRLQRLYPVVQHVQCQRVL